MTEYSREEALALGHTTFILGPSQISMQDTEWGPYLLNCITDPEVRGHGHARRLHRAVMAAADRAGIAVVSHPDTPELMESALAHGYEIVPEAPTYKDMPLLRRPPQPWDGTLDPDLQVVNTP